MKESILKVLVFSLFVCGVSVAGQKKLEADCYGIYSRLKQKTSGVYKIQPYDKGSPISVYCDMETDGGGWTVFQRRQDGSVNFDRKWDTYKAGFGNLRAEFWLGNDNLHRLTYDEDYTLRVDITDENGKKYYASYDYFVVDKEARNYRVNFGSYSGTAGDGLKYHNYASFTTKDFMNTYGNFDCSGMFKGGWWYKNCYNANLNGDYKSKNFAGIKWKKGNKWIGAKKIEMKMKSS